MKDVMQSNNGGEASNIIGGYSLLKSLLLTPKIFQR